MMCDSLEGAGQKGIGLGFYGCRGWEGWGVRIAFGFKIPEGCAPLYISRKKSPKRRGRPAKRKIIREE